MRTRLLLSLLFLPLATANTCTQRTPFPAFVSSDPAAAASVSPSAWILLHFAAAVPADAVAGVTTFCNDTLVPTRKHLLDADTVVVQPIGDLPAGASCESSFNTEAGPVTLDFQTSSPPGGFSAVYDRSDPERPLPFPDDAFLVPDPSTATGFRLNVVIPNPPGSAFNLIRSLRNVAQATSDGWSPIGNLSVELSQAPSQASLPLDRAASLDPLSSIALIDMTPGSTSFGERIPFKLTPRSDTFSPEPVSHNLVLFPGIPLEPTGSYGLVVTDRVLDAGGSPLERSAFFRAATAAPVAGEAPEVGVVRPLAEEVLLVAESLSPVPIPRDDVALAVRIRVRSTSHFVDDLLAMRADVLATPPNVTITGTQPGGGSVAAFVEGTFDVPRWLTSVPFVNRGATGLPEAVDTQTVPFILALPTSAAAGTPAPIVMYQHGNPGSAQGEVPGAAQSFLAGGGFAVAGFTDTLNRQFTTSFEQQFAILGVVLFNGEAPDFYIQTYAEQMAFLRALQSMDTLDLLPLGNPDGVPDLDPTRIVYEGISYGSTHGQAFLAYAPDILAAGMVVGAVRLIELLEYQDRTQPTGDDPLLRVTLPSFVTGIRAPDLWMGLSLFAVTYDRQDAHNHARFLFREPVSVGGTTQKASLLVVEGIDDSFTKNNSTRSLAWQLGPIPQLSPAIVPLPDLPQQSGPIQANLDPQTTAAMVQFAPTGAGVPPTPGCGPEGHFCAQSAPSARAQRLDFYQSALVGPPVID